MMNRFQWMWSEYPFKQTELVCSKTSLNFVDSIFEIFGALGCGIPILIVPPSVRSDPEQLVQLLGRARVTRLIAVPSLLRSMLHIRPDLASALPHLRTWTLSGEVRCFFFLNLVHFIPFFSSKPLDLFTYILCDLTISFFFFLLLFSDVYFFFLFLFRTHVFSHRIFFLLTFTSSFLTFTYLTPITSHFWSHNLPGTTYRARPNIF